jgi:hypothetical protein
VGWSFIHSAYFDFRRDDERNTRILRRFAPQDDGGCEIGWRNSGAPQPCVRLESDCLCGSQRGIEDKPPGDNF